MLPPTLIPRSSAAAGAPSRRHGHGLRDRQDLGDDLQGDLGRRLTAELEPDRATDLVGDLVAERLAPLRLRAPRAERADVVRATRDTGLQRREVESLLVHERDHSRARADLDLVGPRHHELIGARHALARREARPRLDDLCVPAERARHGADRLGDIACPDDHEARRRRDPLGEHRAALFLAQPCLAVGLALPALTDAVTRDDDVARSAVDVRHAGVRLDEHVDLAAAGQPDLPRDLVGDAVRHERRRAVFEHELGLLGDVGLDATARDGAEEPVAADRELGAERPRRRAPAADDGRQHDLLACGTPLLGFGEHLVHRVT